MDVNSVAPIDLSMTATAAAPPVAVESTVAVEAPEKQGSAKAHSSANLAELAEKTEKASSGGEHEGQGQALSREMVEKTVDQINKSLTSYRRELQVSVHDKLNRIMVKVYDSEENKVIREIPPEKVLDAFAKTLELAGILIDKKR